MTQGEKDLVLKDLSARLPYDDYKVQIKEEEDYIPRIAKLIPSYIDDIKYCTIASIKVYLRPMSSMTEEEKREYYIIYDSSLADGTLYKVIDWLNLHHIDYRRLIEKGLALPAPEGMYNSFNNF